MTISCQVLGASHRPRHLTEPCAQRLPSRSPRLGVGWLRRSQRASAQLFQKTKWLRAASVQQALIGRFLPNSGLPSYTQNVPVARQFIFPLPPKSQYATHAKIMSKQATNGHGGSAKMEA